MGIPFDQINDAVMVNLKSVVSSWIPGGRFEGVEYVVKNPQRPDNHAGSFKINTATGIWSDFAAEDVGGKDPISLFAYIENMSQGDAAKALANDYNIMLEPLKKKKPSGNWTPIIPVPDDAPDPPKKYPKKVKGNWTDHKIKHLYEYKTKQGNRAGYGGLVIYPEVKKSGKQSKEIIPITYCRNGDNKEWRFKSFSIPRPIYKMNLLVEYPEAQVIVVEGEKCAGSLQGLFNPESVIVISWIGGGKGATTIKWDLLKGRRIVFWPDADSQEYKKGHPKEYEVMDFVDQPGASTMIKIYNMTKGITEGARLVKPPDKYENGWDCADAVADGWDVDKILGFIKDNLIKFDDIIQKPDAGTSLPFQCLGYNSYSGSVVYYYLPVGTHKVTALSAAAHTKMNLLSLASVQHFEREYPQKTGADYVAAANDAMRQCERVGIYDPLRCRGRGAWFDNGRTVLHLGNKLIVDDKEIKIDKIKSFFIYEAEIPTEDAEGFVFNPLPKEGAEELIKMCKMISWENSISGTLFAGWVMLAPVCGAIEWRPHIWITGETGTGKTWILENIVSQVLGRTVFNAQSNSTEAGIRQSLRSDAFPVKCDEIETEDHESFRRVQRILELARQSSSNKASSIVKGTTGGRAISYCIRSCFMFSSINPKLIQAADESRITILKLIKRADYEEGNRFDILREMVIDTLTDDYCTRLRSRAIKLIPIIRQNVVVFTAIMSKIFRSKRLGDQIGSLVAGAYALKHDDIVPSSDARAWAESIDWMEETTIEDKTDQSRCLDVILQQLVRTDDGNKREAVGGLIREAGRPSASTVNVDEYNKIEDDRVRARDVLRKYGITTIKNRELGTYQVAFAENHTLLSKLLIDTPWNNGYKLVLMRNDGAVSKSAVFADKRRLPAIAIPYNKIFTEEVDEDVELERF